jgi:hypothetical protein
LEFKLTFIGFGGGVQTAGNSRAEFEIEFSF